MLTKHNGVSILTSWMSCTLSQSLRVTIWARTLITILHPDRMTLTDQSFLQEMEEIPPLVLPSGILYLFPLILLS